jgi:hypothetical protein
MTDIQRIRFTTANYSRLQGLKAVPSGLLLFVITLWSNSQTGPARDLNLPIFFLAAGTIIYALIDRYYRRNFGRVEQSRKEYWMDVLFSIAFSGLVLAAFFLDMTARLPASVFALVFAIGLLLDYFLMLRRAEVRSWRIIPSPLVVILLIGATALFPLLGRETWTGLGFRSPLFAVYAVDGLLVILFGLIGHIQLGVSMASSKEA